MQSLNQSGCLTDIIWIILKHLDYYEFWNFISNKNKNIGRLLEIH